METPKDIDRAAIEEHAQRMVEQTGLRKVREALERIEQAEIAERRTLRKVLIVCTIMAALRAWLFWWLTFDDRDLAKAPPMKIPDTFQSTQ